MTKLLPIVVVALILAALAEWNSVYKLDPYGEKVYIRKDKFFFTIMAIILIVFVGLRTRYNDTRVYVSGYEALAMDVTALKTIDWRLGSNPGFTVTNALLRIVGASKHDFLMFYAAVTIGIYVWFLRKYTTNIWMTLFLFFTMGCYTFTMAAIKQCVAVAFCLVAVDCAMKKKWGPFVFWIALASTFHPYSIMYVVAPFLMFRPWTRKTFMLLILFATIGFSLQSLLGTLINITTMMGERYDVSSFSGDGVNVFRLAVVWVPVFFSFLTRKVSEKSSDEQSNIIVNFAMLNAEIMFIALFGTANYFARLANYFLIFQALSLPKIFDYFNENSKKIMKIGAIIGYSLYFYYAEAIHNGGFDAQCTMITFGEYLKIFFRIGG